MEKTFNPMKYVLPGLFLLALGLGNLSVGHFKRLQYEEVLQELSTLELSPKLDNSSPLARIQVAHTTATRVYQRKAKARARRDFYELVLFGGKLFLLLGSVSLCLGAVLHWLKKSSPQPTNPETEETL